MGALRRLLTLIAMVGTFAIAFAITSAPAAAAPASPAKIAAPVRSVAVAGLDQSSVVAAKQNAAKATIRLTLLHQEQAAFLTRYANPLRQVSGLSPNRIDQGVDYCGYGPIFSIGTGRIVMVYGNGWPGVFIAVHLTMGRLAGRVWYAAESIVPYVHIGEAVTSRTVIGKMVGCNEVGWADPRLLPNTMARDTGEYAFPTLWGKKMSWLLHHLGAPAGIP